MRKRRYAVDGFSLDVFEGALTGLVLVEREAKDAAALAGLAAPVWTVREVTHDPRFEGGALARLDVDSVRELIPPLTAPRS